MTEKNPAAVALAALRKSERRSCAACGTEFDAYGPKQGSRSTLYCSDRCRWRAYYQAHRSAAARKKASE